MTFAAEPFGLFVDDLVSGLTGGVVREELRFGVDGELLQLDAKDDFVDTTVRVTGLADGRYTRFRKDIDFTIDGQGVVTFLESAPGLPRAGATWPDRGSRLWVNYERKPERHPPPRLTDRNPGSVVRTLAESFAREYAVLSKQLESVYRAGFIGTAEGRDLDQLVALVGVERRTRAVARGEVVFSRPTPSPADIFVPVGTRVSTHEVPASTVETVDPATLRAGALSVAVPVQALVPGPDGAAKPLTLTVIHRPILGIDGVTNPVALTFGGDDETDDALRRRAARALETAGRATVGALTGALMAIEGIREQDVRIVEDPLAHPGTIKVQIAAELDPAHRAAALQAIRDVRPAGIRVEHTLDVPEPPVGPPTGSGTGGGGTGGGDTGGGGGSAPADSVFYPVDVHVEVTPLSSGLTAAQKAALQSKVEAAVRGAIERYGIGETIVYRRLVAEAMAVEGVYDVDVTLVPSSATARPSDPRLNLAPEPRDRRPKVGTLSVTVRGALVALDVEVVFTFVGPRPVDPTATIGPRKDQLAATLRDLLAGGGITQITAADLLSRLQSATPPGLSVDELHYTAELLEDGLRLLQADVPITLADAQPWLRSFNMAEGTQVAST